MQHLFQELQMFAIYEIQCNNFCLFKCEKKKCLAGHDLLIVVAENTGEDAG